MGTRIIVQASTLYVFLTSGLPGLRAQAPVFTDLTIDVENVVEYQGDIADPLAFARNPEITPARGNLVTNPDGIGNFAINIGIGDIVAINGQPAKGLLVLKALGINVTPNPVASQAIGDVTRVSMREMTFELLQADGTPVGVIMTTGLGAGRSAVGSPSTVRGAWAVVGRTGPFVALRGQAEQQQEGSTGEVLPRRASMADNPARRRINGGGSQRYFLHLVPMIVPSIVMTANTPAVVHSADFSPVSASRPAAAGEVLSLFATGLGAVRGGVENGQPFPSNPPAPVNSPVQVLVNGKLTEVLAAVGYPGSRDGYQVNFRLPPDLGRGTATLQLSAAWITSSAVTIAVHELRHQGCTAQRGSGVRSRA